MLNLTIAAQRKKAFEILIGKLKGIEYEPFDYFVDDACRKVFNLQPRPVGALPYVGWMVGAPEKEKPQLTISAAGLELIKSFEGCKLGAYLCPAKVWTIGWGHTATVKPGQIITQAQADNLLIRDLAKYEAAVRNYVRVPLEQHQFDALVSLCYNIGAEGFRKSSLLRYLNEGKYQLAALQFHRWANANGKKLPGLVRRRNEEYGMFVGD
jgi:lysozyme